MATTSRVLRSARRWMVAPLAALLVSTGLIGFHLTDAQADAMAAGASTSTTQS